MIVVISPSILMGKKPGLETTRSKKPGINSAAWGGGIKSEGEGGGGVPMTSVSVQFG